MGFDFDFLIVLNIFITPFIFARKTRWLTLEDMKY